MTILMIIALAIAGAGVALTFFAYKVAPVSEHFASWDIAFVSGISTTVLGSLGALLQVFTF